MVIRDNENPFLRGKPAKEHFVSQFFEVENPFGKLDDASRKEAGITIAKQNAEKFTAGLLRLNQICRNNNFFQLLAHFGYYDQFVLDPEKEPSKYEPVEQHAAELLQALVLQCPEDDLQNALSVQPPPETLTETNKLLHVVTESFSFKRFDSSDESGKESRLISEMVRTSTAKLRNVGFASQTRRTMTQIVAPLDGAFLERQGFRLTSAAATLWNIVDLIGQRINQDFQDRHDFLRLQSKKEMIDKFVSLYFRDEQSSKGFRQDLEQRKYGKGKLRKYLYSLSDFNHYRFFYLPFNDWINAYPEKVELSVLENVLGRWSISLGELAGDNPEHFILANPIWLKPVMKIGPSHFFLPLPGLIQSFGVGMLETLIQSEPDLWEKYRSKIRPRFLENLAATTLKNAAPDAQVYHGVRWKSPITGQSFETDILVVQDTHVLIAECKAGHVTPRGKRGEIMRLEKDIGKLIEEPTLQSQRFAKLLLESEQPLQLENSHGVQFEVDRSKILRIARLNVMLDDFGVSGIQARLLREAGMVDKTLENAPTMHVHELENTVEILGDSATLMHYLHRRSEIESVHDLLGVERAVLANYLGSGFDWGELEEQSHRAIMMPEMGEELDPYFMGKEINRPVTKPKRRFTPWWNDVLAKVQERKTPGWMESMYGLLSVNFEEQQRFEKGVDQMLSEVDANWKDPLHKNTLFFVKGSPRRRVKIMCVGVKNLKSIEKQREIVRNGYAVADDRSPTPTTLAIVRSLTTKTYPYAALYLLREAPEAS